MLGQPGVSEGDHVVGGADHRLADAEQLPVGAAQDLHHRSGTVALAGVQLSMNCAVAGGDQGSPG